MMRETYGPRFWDNPRSIDVYCTASVEELLSFLDIMFEDLKGTDAEEAQLGHQIFPSNSSDKRRLMRVGEVQLEVLRRAISRKQDAIRQLARGGRILDAEYLSKCHKPHRLPTLPTEIIVKIFCSLYFLERGDAQSWDNRGTSSRWNPNKPTPKSSVWAFLEDANTPETWRNIIQREIPVVIMQAESNREDSVLHINAVQDYLGALPRIIRPNQLDSFPHSSSPTTILMTSTDWETLSGEERVNIGKLPWHCLILAHYEHRGNYQMHFSYIHQVLAFYKRKLVEIERLIILPFEDSSLQVDTRYPNPLLVEPLIEDRIPNIKAASLTLRLMLFPRLRPFLTQITDLEIHVAMDLDTVQMDFEEICGYLRPCLNTLENLTIRDGGRKSGWWMLSRPKENHYPTLPRLYRSVDPTPLPNLKALALDQFEEGIVLDVFACIGAPSLTKLSVSSFEYHNDPHRVRQRGKTLSVAILHDKFPSLEDISISLEGKFKFGTEENLTSMRNSKFFEELAFPHVGSVSRLPRLKVLRLDDNEYGSAPPSFLKTLCEIVMNRLHSQTEDPIRRLTLKCSKEANDSDFARTLELFVPDFSIRS
ncbi:hypothetical protein SCHPADRAFT_935215 [Schizopora paradoxa]|uniref:Uncharacterized protein n=1 Tax=Schizopora paradoxa TaxID=27342 RepID=A0A0H2S623_9AGAM|nr:hypothetical protein SCHPADRAFT_935215 [Schizopora paradoxa]